MLTNKYVYWVSCHLDQEGQRPSEWNQSGVDRIVTGTYSSNSYEAPGQETQTKSNYVPSDSITNQLTKRNESNGITTSASNS